MLRSWDSSPQSLTTTHEQLTTLRALPSRSIWPVKIRQHFYSLSSTPPTPKQLTQPRPLAQLLPIRHLNQRDLVLAAQRHNQLLISLLLARLIEHAHVSLATIEGLARLAQTARQAVVDEGDFEYALERVERAHAAGFGVRGHIDFVRCCYLLLADVGGVGGLFSVRLWGVSVSRCGYCCSIIKLW